jgi:maltose O-acetyltransferase
MLNALRHFKFYFKYYLTNHWINRIPFHCVRQFWYRRMMGIKIGRHVQIWLGCKFVGDNISEIEIADHVVISNDVTINASRPICIGERTTIASGVKILTTDHDPQDPHFAPRKASVTIGARVWIATNAILLKGTTVGNGSVIGAGAVVSGEIAPLSLVAGNPGRVFGKRAPFEPAPNERAEKPPLFC